MTNAQIAAVFEEMADLLEFQGANAFRVRAYRNAASKISDLSESLKSIDDNPDRRLDDVAGIGKDLSEKIKVLLKEGVLPQHQKLLKEVPPSTLSLLKVPSLGPKKAAIICKELGVKNLEDLRKACEEKKVQKLKGFGEKTEQNILKNIDQAIEAGKRIPWKIADEIAKELSKYLKQSSRIKRLEVAGSYRRGKETIGDLDFLVISEKPEKVMDHFTGYPELAEVIGRGDTKMSIRLTNGLQVDLRVVPKESFGAALLYFTGSKNHNIVIRGLAKDEGLKINEYGVYRGEEKVAGETEEEIYQLFDLPTFPPELRENRKEFEWGREKKLPHLIELKDLQGDLHTHSTFTDGRNTIEEMCKAAEAAGFQYFAVTDHSKRVTMANGLTAERLREQWKTIDKIQKQFKQLTILKGIECDILEEGGMDLPDDVLKEADWVVASVHYGQQQPKEKITRRIVEALKHPAVSVLGHPTGRLINQRPPYEVDLEEVFQAASDYGKFLELNSSYMRLDLNDVACATAKEKNIPIIISSDAHSTEGFKTLRYGILQARRAGLTKEDVANTWDWKEIQKYLKK
ncbi:DNA polymerase III subunit beta [Planctomycetales bacterium 10988]|nr:DNA polymerase III subunit beta [Planctomycetales bacterium 10988]